MKNSKIYIVCPDVKSPTGGIKQLYKLCETLQKNKYNATIVHEKKGFKLNWFQSSAKITYFPFLFYKIKKLNRKKKLKYYFKDFFKNLFLDKSLPETDALIIYPEIYGSKVHTLTNNKFIIYNQNCYYTFDHFPNFKDLEKTTYKSDNLVGILTVSDDSLNYLNKAFPKKNTEKITLGVSSIFSYSDKKEKIIAFMPRKLKEDVNQIYNILQKNTILKDWKWVPIDNCSESEVAEILKKSAIFLSFNYNEGFGLPPVEAMACGCYVIGYAGNAGNEYLKEEFSSKIADRNIVDFTEEIKEKAKLFNDNQLNLIALGKMASDFVIMNYNLQTEERTTIRAFNNLTKE